jgi:hypothetical protein
VVARLFVLPLVAAMCTGQTAGQFSPSATARAVQEVTERSKVSDIQFSGFSFQQPDLYELSVHYGEIEGDLSARAEYAVEAVIEGADAIATATFDAIDENGNAVERVLIVPQADGGPGSYEFIGVMTVPPHPFRIVLSGESVDGHPFRRVYGRLFRPVNTPYTGWSLPPDFPDRDVFLQMFDELAPHAVDERRRLVAQNPTGVIVMPRTQVSHVMYAPLLSAAGRPIGIRITYDVEFSENGRSDPSVLVLPEDGEGFIGHSNPLHPLRSRIEPSPHEVHAPEKEPQDIPGLFAQRADFLYDAATRYRFSLELVPDHIILDKDNTTVCVLDQRLRPEPDRSRTLARIEAHEGPQTYRVSMGTLFEGRIENFLGEGAMYRNLRLEGVRGCADHH